MGTSLSAGGGGGGMENQYIGELPKKGGLDSLLIQGGLGKKEGSVFEGGGWYPNAHYENMIFL